MSENKKSGRKEEIRSPDMRGRNISDPGVLSFKLHMWRKMLEEKGALDGDKLHL